MSAPREQGGPGRPAPGASGPGRATARLGAGLLALLAVGALAGALGVAVKVAWEPLVALDEGVTDGAERAVTASPALLAAARAATLLGDPVGLWVAALVVAAVLAARGHRRAAVLLLVVRLGAQVLSSGLKVLVDRARPVFDVPVDAALGASWPSGHSLGAAALWSALAVVALPHVAARWRPLLLGGAVAVALLVATSRVLLGLHYVSDVVGGVLLGALWTALCAAVVVRWALDEGERVDRVSQAVDEP